MHILDYIELLASRYIYPSELLSLLSLLSIPHPLFDPTSQPPTPLKRRKEKVRLPFTPTSIPSIQTTPSKRRERKVHPTRSFHSCSLVATCEMRTKEGGTTPPPTNVPSVAALMGRGKFRGKKGSHDSPTVPVVPSFHSDNMAKIAKTEAASQLVPSTAVPGRDIENGRGDSVLCSSVPSVAVLLIPGNGGEIIRRRGKEISFGSQVSRGIEC